MVLHIIYIAIIVVLLVIITVLLNLLAKAKRNREERTTGTPPKTIKKSTEDWDEDWMPPKISSNPAGWIGKIKIRPIINPEYPNENQENQFPPIRLLDPENFPEDSKAPNDDDLPKPQSHPSNTRPPFAPVIQHVGVDNVALALSSPSVLVPKNNYTIKFIAYLEKDEKRIATLLKDLSPQNTNLLNLDFCQWKLGTKITVRLYSTYLAAEEETQTFEWLGKHKIVNFDVRVLENAPVDSFIDVKTDVLIRGVVIAKLRSSIKIGLTDAKFENTVKGKPYETAFASYSRKDSDQVIGRLSEIERNGVKIFFDRISLHSGELWKNELDLAIKESEIFLLFWSANAKNSENVKWEWQTALKYKGLSGIEPHPLENPDVAEPPEELKPLHFDDKYLYFKNKE